MEAWESLTWKRRLEAKRTQTRNFSWHERRTRRKQPPRGCLNRCSLNGTRLVRAAAAAAKSLQSCPTLCDPIDGSLPGSRVPGILQARTLEWVAISFSNAGKWKVKVKSLSRVRLLVTPWTAAYQAPPPMGFSRQEYWSGVPLPSPRLVRRHWLFNGKISSKIKHNSSWKPLYDGITKQC